MLFERIVVYLVDYSILTDLVEEKRMSEFYE